MKLHEHPNFWPWACGLATIAAMTLGLVADGVADTLAAFLLAIPTLVVFRKLAPARKRHDA